VSNEIAKAVEKGVKDVAEHAGSRFGKLAKEFYEETGKRMVKSAEHVAEAEAKSKKLFENIAKDSEKGLAQDAKNAEKGLAGAPPGERGPGLGNAERGGGQSSEGNGKCPHGLDPVDLISGQMIMSETDLELPGLLPVILRRAYASGYVGGRLFGPGWSSTLDQRLEIDDNGIHYAGDDAQILHYPRPSLPGRRVLPADGAQWPLSWDHETDTYTIEDPESGWVRHFERSGADPDLRPLTALSDRNGHRITYTRHDDGSPVAIDHSGGYRLGVNTTHTDGGYRIEAIRLFDGTDDDTGTKVIEYRYDQFGRLSGVVSTGVPYRYEHDDHDRITSWIDRLGYRYHYTYDTHGRVISGQGDGGYLSGTFGYDLDNRTTTLTNSLGHSTVHHYDENNHLTKIVDPLGNTTSTELDRHGRLLSFTDPLGHTTRYTLNQAGDPIRVDRPDGSHISVGYDERWRLPTRITSPGDIVWQHSYDDRGNLLTTTDPSGAVSTCVVDERGHLAAVTDPAGQTWRYESNGVGRPLSVTTPQGAVTRIGLDAFGHVTVVTDASGQTTRFGWTVEGRLGWQTTPNGAREEFTYDAQGNLLESRSPAGGTTVFEVGPLGVLAARTGQDGTRYEFEYTTELRLARVINPTGLTWDYEYDASGNLVHENDFAGRSVRYGYDAVGRQMARTEGSSPTVTITRDALGRPVVQHVEGEAAVEFGYDTAGRLWRASDGDVEMVYQYDVMGRPIAETVDGLTVTNEYDALGRRTRRTTPSGIESVCRYTPAGHEATLTGTAGELAFSYDRSGNETYRYLGPGAALTQAFDQLGRITTQNLWAADGMLSPEAEFQTVQRRTFQYRADGVISAINDQLRGNRAYELTPAGRVTTVQAAGWTERYAYDALGNLSTAESGQDSDSSGDRVLEGALLRSAGRTNFEYDDQGRLVRSVRRTLSGRRKTWTFSWNTLGQLTVVTTPDGHEWRYRYDPLGRRIGKRRMDQSGALLAETRFVWEGSRLAEQQEFDASSDRVTATVWDYRARSGHPLAQTFRSWLRDAPSEVIDSRFHAVITDLVGTPTELIAPDGRIAWHQTTNLWGNRVAVTAEEGVDCPLRFPGQYHDPETGLHYNFHRYYDPETARYLTPDPLGLPPAPNNYTYVANPLIVSDPLGLDQHRGSDGRYASDPANPPTGHNRSTEYPHEYWPSTHDEMARRFTVEGQTQGGVPIDQNGIKIPRDQLNWVDANGNPIPYKDLTYDHNPSVVQHWNETGNNQSAADREAWYNKTDDMEAMTRSENSRKGAQEELRYADRPPGPNYGCK
jgi:RHS repeat-associated protein